MSTEINRFKNSFFDNKVDKCKVLFTKSEKIPCDPCSKTIGVIFKNDLYIVSICDKPCFFNLTKAAGKLYFERMDYRVAALMVMSLKEGIKSLRSYSLLKGEERNDEDAYNVARFILKYLDSVKYL